MSFVKFEFTLYLSEAWNYDFKYIARKGIYRLNTFLFENLNSREIQVQSASKNISTNYDVIFNSKISRDARKMYTLKFRLRFMLTK